MNIGNFLNNAAVIAVALLGVGALIFGGKNLIEALIAKLGMLGAVGLILGVIVGGGLLLGFYADVTGDRETIGIFDLFLGLFKGKISIEPPF